MTITFEALQLSQKTIKRLATLNITTPSPIQSLAIPKLLTSKAHHILQAQTGTGKTAAFLLPLLENIQANQKLPQALILTPTRELAKQVFESLKILNTKSSLRAQLLIGGTSIRQQLHFLKGKTNILIGTPGRVLDHLQKQKSIDLSNLSHLILDEADEMMDMGFVEEIETIIKACPKQKQMIWVSATMPKAIVQLAHRFMPDHQFLQAATNLTTKQNTTQHYLISDLKAKYQHLKHLLTETEDIYTVIFCKTKKGVDTLKDKLRDDDIHATAIHGDMPQPKRERNLKRMKDRKTSILIATDIAARGLHVDNLSHVLNYDIPENVEIYQHRIGRTGRAERKGEAITFVTQQEYRKLRFFEKDADLTLHQHTLSEAPSKEGQTSHKNARTGKKPNFSRKRRESQTDKKSFASSRRVASSGLFEKHSERRYKKQSGAPSSNHFKDSDARKTDKKPSKFTTKTPKTYSKYPPKIHKHTTTAKKHHAHRKNAQLEPAS